MPYHLHVEKNYYESVILVYLPTFVLIGQPLWRVVSQETAVVAFFLANAASATALKAIFGL